MKKAIHLIVTLQLAANITAQEPKLMLPIGHTDYVASVAFSPDGKKIVTSSFDQTAKIWDAQTGILLVEVKGEGASLWSAVFNNNGKKIAITGWDDKTRIADAETGALLFELPGKTSPAEVVFSPDGRKIITPSSDNTVKIWDAQTGALLAELKGHTNTLSGNLSVSTDGKKIVSGSKDKTAKIWDAQTGTLLSDLKLHTGEINVTAFSPDGKMVATGSSDQTARIWDARTGSLIASLNDHESKVTSVLFSPDGKKLLTACWNDAIKIWDTQSGRLLHSLRNSNFAIEVFFSPDSKKILAVAEETGLTTWDVQTGSQLFTKALPFDMLTSVALSPDGKTIVTGDDKNAELWDTETGFLVASLRGHAPVVYSAVFSGDGKQIITSEGNSAKLWDAQTGRLLSHFKGHRGDVFSAVFSPDDKMIATTSFDTTAKLWNSQTGALLSTLRGHTALVWMSDFSPDGKKLLTVSNDNTPRLWNVETGSLIAALEGHTNTVSSAAFSPDGKKIVTGSFDHFIKVWDAQTGRLLVNLVGHTENINSTVFSPDGKMILSSSFDSTARLWDAQTGRIIRIIRGHTDCVYDAEFSPDGKRLVTASFDGTAKIWIVQTGSMFMNLKNHKNYILDNAKFSPDGKKIIGISGDQVVRVWDAASGVQLAAMEGHNNSIKSANISPDGKYIITASADNTFRKWNVATGDLLYSFFDVDSSDYLLVDKYNHYDGTSGGRKLIYFTCADEVIELEQVKDQLWVPNLAERINNNETIHAKKLSDLNLCGLTPQTERADVSSNEYRFIITPRRGGLGETILYVNGIEVKRYKLAQLIKVGGKYELRVKTSELINYFVTGAENPVSVKAYTADNAISSRGFKINADESKQISIPPNLYAVMVGISDYKGDELDLKYAAKDATDISNAIEAAAKKLLNNDGKEHVFMYNLTTAANHYQLPEKNGIKNLLEEIGKKATANDILLIFFAGHGKTESEKQQFYFLTSDASVSAVTSAVADVGISTAELTEWMKPSVIKAQKRVLIFDACNSGQAIRDFVKLGAPDQNYIAARSDEQGQQTKAIDKLNEQSGFFILSASASDQNAYEMGRYSQGLLTYALLKAIKQQPDILEDGKYLDVSRWFNAAGKTVSDISKENGARQQPQLITNTNFNIGMVDAEVMAKIVLPQEKPLFAASNFQNSDDAIADDDLDLSKLINLQLNDMATRGTDAKIVYVTATNSPDAYSLSGRYTVKGNAITVTVNIKQNKTVKNKFEISGSKDKLNELAASISNKAAGMVK